MYVCALLFFFSFRVCVRASVVACLNAQQSPRRKTRRNVQHRNDNGRMQALVVPQLPTGSPSSSSSSSASTSTSSFLAFLVWNDRTGPNTDAGVCSIYTTRSTPTDTHSRTRTSLGRVHTFLVTTRRVCVRGNKQRKNRRGISLRRQSANSSSSTRTTTLRGIWISKYDRSNNSDDDDIESNGALNKTMDSGFQQTNQQHQQ